MIGRRPSGFIAPCQPSKVARPPSGPLWVHEIKQDGCRLMVRRRAPLLLDGCRGATIEGLGLMPWQSPPSYADQRSGVRAPAPLLSAANALLNVGRGSPRAAVAGAGWKCL